VLATLGLALVGGCGARQVTDTIYFRRDAPRSDEGALISSVADRNQPPHDVERFEIRGMVARDPSPPRVIVTFRHGTMRSEVDSFNQRFVTSGLVDHVSVGT
jgi:hypothetical protein